MKKNKPIVRPVAPKFPTILRIGYQDVKVIVDPDTKIPKQDSGQYRDDGFIFLSGEYSLNESVNLLIHEVLHAVYYTYGMRNVIEDKTKEEYLVNTFANGLTQVIKDNPKFLEWVKENLK